MKHSWIRDNLNTIYSQLLAKYIVTYEITYFRTLEFLFKCGSGKEGLCDDESDVYTSMLLEQLVSPHCGIC